LLFCYLPNHKVAVAKNQNATAIKLIHRTHLSYVPLKQFSSLKIASWAYVKIVLDTIPLG
jgi:hypothetical protein